MSNVNSVYNEAFLHFVWQHKLFRTRGLHTQCGLPVDIIHPGFLNSDAGPDFFNVKVKIGEVLWAGNAEIHLKSSDWFAHQHQNDKSYDNVVLHIVGEYDEKVFAHSGNEIPTIVIRPLSHVTEQYDRLIHENQTIACYAHLSKVEPLFLTNFKDRLIVDRLERKTSHVSNLLQKNNNDWQAVFFQCLCRAMGASVNADAFERLGKSISYKILYKHRNNILQLEALLFGQAGFLSKTTDDTYFLVLQKEYNFLKAKYQLVPLEKHLWKFMRLRPSNFPTIRIAQLAELIYSNTDFLHSILIEDKQHIVKLFEVGTSDYWLTHYTFAKLSSSRVKNLGDSTIRSLLINLIVPMLFAYGKARGRNSLCDKAINILESLPSEKNKIITQWSKLGIRSVNAYDSQACIQLFNEFCLHKKCLHCNIGHHFLSLQQTR